MAKWGQCQARQRRSRGTQGRCRLRAATSRAQPRRRRPPFRHCSCARRWSCVARPRTSAAWAGRSPGGSRARCATPASASSWTRCAQAARPLAGRARTKAWAQRRWSSCESAPAASSSRGAESSSCSGPRRPRRRPRQRPRQRSPQGPLQSFLQKSCWKDARLLACPPRRQSCCASWLAGWRAGPRPRGRAAPPTVSSEWRVRAWRGRVMPGS
mmetsp:Transcript_7593/g.30054  ORF Transcript_7593/g.30054 Transcript_7593/m.30054 type:complete len:213 (-) Transcript_7593:31-669(-)